MLRLSALLKYLIKYIEYIKTAEGSKMNNNNNAFRESPKVVKSGGNPGNLTTLPTPPAFKNEDQLQAFCFQWAWNTYPQIRPLLWHVPNGGSRNKIEGMQMKAKGVVPGVHDLHLFWNGRFITFELKFGSATLSEEQEAFAAALLAQGGTWYEIRSFEQFAAAFLSILTEGVVND